MANRVRCVLKRWLHNGLEALYPARCCQCSHLYKLNPVETDEAKWPVTFGALMAHFFCPDCCLCIQPIESPICIRCGRPFKSPHGPDRLCGDCLDKPFRFECARSAGQYTDALRTAIHELKYHGRVHLAGPLAKLLWTTYLHYWSLDWVDLILAVPLHGLRLRQRGFNQAQLLIRPWPDFAAAQGISLSRVKIGRSILIRRRPTRPQTGLARLQRAANLHNAFAVKDKRAIKGRNILLVDDVMTTGTTVNECTHMLIKAGAAQVRVLTLARAL